MKRSNLKMGYDKEPKDSEPIFWGVVAIVLTIVFIYIVVKNNF